MDLNGDGHVDVLSGCYSRHDRDMAGLFQVLWGEGGGKFRKAEALRGTDGEPLVVPTDGSDDALIDRICTRPFAVDFDGDGDLDIVTGNFRGTFAWFAGEGAGKFAPAPTWIEADGQRISVELHSDPFLVDWDGDGDLDLLSGSGDAAVVLFPNTGTAKAPRYAARPITLLPPAPHADDTVRFGDAHLTRPMHATRVWAADVDLDGKLDLLIGDQVTLCHLQRGIEEAAATRELADWSKRRSASFASLNEDEHERFQQTYEAFEKERVKWVRDESTGFVWVAHQK